jgi:chromosome segregation ATPase
LPDDAEQRAAKQAALHGGYKSKAVELALALTTCRKAHAETMRLLDEMTAERDRINRDAERHARRAEHLEEERNLVMGMYDRAAAERDRARQDIDTLTEQFASMLERARELQSRP